MAASLKRPGAGRKELVLTRLLRPFLPIACLPEASSCTGWKGLQEGHQKATVG